MVQQLLLVPMLGGSGFPRAAALAWQMHFIRCVILLSLCTTLTVQLQCTEVEWKEANVSLNKCCPPLVHVYTEHRQQTRIG